jgi:hypothetical protein
MFYTKIDSYNFEYKTCIEIVLLAHVLYVTNLQETYLEETTYNLVPRNMCGVTLSSCFPHYFHAFFM